MNAPVTYLPKFVTGVIINAALVFGLAALYARLPHVSIWLWAACLIATCALSLFASDCVWEWISTRRDRGR